MVRTCAIILTLLALGGLVLFALGTAWYNGLIWTDTPPDGTYSFTNVKAGPERAFIVPALIVVGIAAVALLIVPNAKRYDDARDRM
jgi:hypothetical protein